MNIRKQMFTDISKKDSPLDQKIPGFNVTPDSMMNIPKRDKGENV